MAAATAEKIIKTIAGSNTIAESFAEHLFETFSASDQKTGPRTAVESQAAT
jgi:hypothetical protein